MKPTDNHYPSFVDRNLTYPKMSIPAYFEKTVEEFGHNNAYIYEGKKITYNKLKKWTDRIAHLFLEEGYQSGDKILVVLPNIPQSPITILALMKIGIIPVMGNPLSSPNELRFQYKDANCRAMIVLDLVYENLLNSSENFENIPVYQCQIHTFLPFAKRVLFPYVKKELYIPNVTDFFTECLHQKAPSIPVQTHHGGDLAVLIYTGGTTGSPKGVKITHQNLAANAFQIISWLGAFETAQETVIGTFPFFTGSGLAALMCGSILKAACVVLIPRPTPEGLIKNVLKHSPSIFPAVPTIYSGLINHPDFTEKFVPALQKSLKCALSGAAPINQLTQEIWRKNFAQPIVELYGLTETTAMCHGNPIGRTKLNSVGLAISDTEVKIINENNEEINDSSIGEVCVKGPQVSSGYYNNEAETQKTFINGWLKTGDLGYIDQEGYLFIVDRKKDMILSGGYNVYPGEVDKIILTHPSILECCTVGIPDDYLGDRVTTFVKFKTNMITTELEIITFARQKMAKYKAPREIVFVTEFPKNPLGKILKKELLSNYINQATHESSLH